MIWIDLYVPVKARTVKLPPVLPFHLLLSDDDVPKTTIVKGLEFILIGILFLQ